ncbi:hypothetical protein BD626DRAFT_473361 [Schizophyllum amplum]|uniref:Hemerythrin-like domain-containing protein n=1 Tax=Schizophyllum amplum TaxID=97359 RepID=A0A550CWR1_9AGAR|nr:hypothetical protein BD626DRAFT_473361 [Auriculariopsis ampla]
MFPLATLPVSDVPADLVSGDPRATLRHINTFMKNDLIRALNSVQSAGSRVSAGQPTFVPFLEYATRVCDVLEYHLEGDETFFTCKEPRLGGRSLFEIFGYANPTHAATATAGIQALKDKLSSWRQNPSSYSVSALTEAMSFAGPMAEGMKKQVAAIREDVLNKVISAEAMGDMIQENLIWFTGRFDAAFLVPFVIAHHDVASAAAWPPLGPDAETALPDLVQEHKELWQFAPYDPITRVKCA